VCERRVARRRGSACEEECESESNPKPRPKPKPSSADVIERGVASIGVRSSENLCVEEEYVQGEAGAHSTTSTYTVRGDSPAREPSWSAFWLQKPSILRACVREEDAGEREAGAHSTTPTYTVRRDSPAREPSWSAFWLQKPSILRVCVREEDAGGRQAGAHSTNLKRRPVVRRLFMVFGFNIWFWFTREEPIGFFSTTCQSQACMHSHPLPRSSS
jgi:hypothetical protein